MKKLIHLLTILAGLSTTVIASADYCAERKVIEQEIDASDFSEIHLSALAGSLILESSASDIITIHGTACANKQSYLDRMRIDTKEKSSILEINAVIPYNDSDWFADYASIDLEVIAPAHITHWIKDSSGDLEANDITISRLEDSSGDIQVINSRGKMSIRDSSGHLAVRGHKGSLEIQDSSGDIEVVETDGDVRVTRDSSGDIEIESVTGFVAVDRDSSGDIRIETVGKTVEIGTDGGGTIKIANVEGSVEIGNDGSGEIVARSIGGDFSVKRKGTGDIRTKNIAGDISIPNF